MFARLSTGSLPDFEEFGDETAQRALCSAAQNLNLSRFDSVTARRDRMFMPAAGDQHFPRLGFAQIFARRKFGAILTRGFVSHINAVFASKYHQLSQIITNDTHFARRG